MKHALICGVSGQDGSYLARLLLDKGYKVFGTSRDAQNSTFINLRRLGIHERMQIFSMTSSDFHTISNVFSKAEPDEVYNLFGQSSVGLSFDQPIETVESISIGTLNLLEAIRSFSKKIRFYNSGSSECFGDTGGEPANEDTPFRPRSPYAVAKSAAYWQVANYREAYNLFACSGISFNHESCLRPERFVTKKIIETARRIANGSKERLVLGNTKIIRDWGWAPEYVEVMWNMLQMDSPEDYVIATGKSASLERFVELAFEKYGLDWRAHVETCADLFRPTDLSESRANPQKAAVKLGWRARYDVSDVVKFMIEGHI